MIWYLLCLPLSASWAAQLVPGVVTAWFLLSAMHVSVPIELLKFLSAFSYYYKYLKVFHAGGEI